MDYIRNFTQVHAALKVWAGKLHAAKGQTWAESKPYSAHLDAVEGVLDRFGYTDMENPVHQVLHLAAQAHDLMEDTGTSRTTLRVLQGPDVERLVWAVTDEPGANRAERHQKTYPKVASTPFATVLKLADRISNVEASTQCGPARLLEMYRKEHPEFRAALRHPGSTEEPMWDYLDGLLRQEPQVEALTTTSQPVQRGLFE